MSVHLSTDQNISASKCKDEKLIWVGSCLCNSFFFFAQARPSVLVKKTFTINVVKRLPERGSPEGKLNPTDV